MEKLQREVRILKAYALVTTLIMAVVAFAGARQINQKTKFAEIDVERINIVEKDGKLKMVISNSERQHPGVIDGRTLSRKRPAGLLFFNDQGDECGGLAYSGNQKDGKTNANALLAFDRFHQDQTVGLTYSESNGKYTAALRVWDRPDSSLGPVVDKLNEIEKMSDGPAKTAAMKELREMVHVVDRVMVGRDQDQAAVIRLADTNGRPRINLSVDAAGSPKLEFLDEKGTVVYRLPVDGASKEKTGKP